MKLTACILDDELLAIASLKVDIERYFPNVEIAETFQSPIKAKEFLNKEKIDLLFLDIEMPEMNGLSFLEDLGHFNFDVIFTTAYDEYALAAIKLKATDYLLKPISIESLTDAISYVEQKRSKTQNNTSPLKIALTDSTGIEFVALNNVMYCTADKNYTSFYMANKQKKIVCKNLGEYEKLLNPNVYIRIHQSSLININYVTKLTKGDNCSVFMEDGMELGVSRAKKNDLIDALQKLL